ncbi:hypothetical protein ANO11243_063600 [Dothideomycetidae sp. 11243]|nr:hypothetical protein ANO11243_063600 [fungal sp. No.11243]
MTEALSLATSAPGHQRPQASTVDFTPYHHNPPPASLPTEETADDDDGEIACICAFNGDDGNTIQCDKCLRWQHISCYYPPPKEVPGEDQKHYCTDCVPQPDLDSRRATDRQRRLLEHRNGVNGIKRSANKSTKKKVKDSPSLSAQVNGWSDRHSHLHSHDRKSASPRDQPPPAKKPKTSHRSSNSVSNPSGRKRAGTANVQPLRSPSKSPELNTSIFIPQYSDDFLHLFQPHSPQVETVSNLMNNIAITNLLSDWLTDSDAVARVTGGLNQTEIFKRWDGQMDDIPGRPEITIDWEEDTSFTSDGITPRWARLAVLSPIATGTFIGELRGRIGLKDEYVHEPDGRWHLLHHPEPFVFFHPQLPICIDARQEGSVFRFVRRSCNPNAELQTIITEGTEYHFCFMATREIAADEEVTVGWQVPDTIRERINSSLATSSNFQPKVRDYFSTWVSNVLSNCGPCACNSPSTCLMARYDRRGRSPPMQPTRTKKKRKVPMLDPVATSRSRSTSEARKVEQDEDRSDSRSVSGSRGSASRDITPSTHYSVNASAGVPELSERERKKLMREEEMFKRQEEESGKLRKKRNSGGSSLNTPSAPSSVRSSIVEGQRRPRTDGPERKHSSSQTNGTSSRHNDAATSSRPQLTSRSSSGKRKASSSSKPSRREAAAPPRSTTYVDASVQCELDDVGANRASTDRPRKRYISVQQRLLQRCMSNNLKSRTASSSEKRNSTSKESGAATVKADQSQSSSSAIVSTNTESAAEGKRVPTSNSDADTVMQDVTEPVWKPSASAVKVEQVSGLVARLRSQEVEPRPKKERDQFTAPPVPNSSPQSAAETLDPAQVSEIPLLRTSSPDQMEDVVPAIPPPADTANPHRPEESQVNPPKDSPSEKVIPMVEPEAAHTKPVMHLDMPPPPLSITAPQPAIASMSSFAQSPTVTTPGPLPALTMPLFSPSVAAAVSPSPIRKKLSLSDYTKRSKARESLGGETSNPSSLGKELKDKDDASPTISSRVLDSSRQDTDEAMTDEPTIKEQKPEEGKVEQSERLDDSAAEKSQAVLPAPTAPMMGSAPVATTGVGESEGGDRK